MSTMTEPVAATAPVATEAGATKDDDLLEVDGLVKRFPLRFTVFDAMLRRECKSLTAVDGVSLTLARGETLGLVGESGCGKSTLARAIINLYRPTEGKVVFDGTDLSSLSKHELRERCGDIQMIFQDPYSSLKEQADRLPSAFSGGQRQRIGIARALAAHPKLIIADEPVSALDVSIQAQIINLLIDLKERLNLAILFISHDLRVVRYISDRVAVMYLGSIVETAPTDELYDRPRHPYTQALLEAAPSLEESREKETKTFVRGELPSPINMPRGCRFHPRCPYATERCKTERPGLRDAGDGHSFACHNPLVG